MISLHFKQGLVRSIAHRWLFIAGAVLLAGVAHAGQPAKFINSSGDKNNNRQLLNVGQFNNSNNNANNSNNNNSKPLDLHRIVNNKGNDTNTTSSTTTSIAKIDKLKQNKPVNQLNNAGNSLVSNKLKLADKQKFKDYCQDKCVHHCFPGCPWWYCWNYPCWQSLYSCGCGYWYDVPVVEIAEGVDLQLLAVRMIDAGDPEHGPAFRVWVRNNSHITIDHPFNVLLLAARDEKPEADLPQAGVRVSAINAGQVLPIDIRLPATANQPGLPMLHVLVDSHREIAEVFEDNNGAILKRADILPVDAPEGAAATPVAAQ